MTEVHDSRTQANAAHSPAFRELTAKLLRSPRAPKEDRESVRSMPTIWPAATPPPAHTK